MIRVPRLVSAGLTALALALAAVLPLSAVAQGAAPAPSCPSGKAHSLPKGPGSTAVFSFGVKGGSLRPWSVKVALDGSIAATGTTTMRQQLNDPKTSLNALLTLADAETFFSFKKAIGCAGSAGNLDVSSQFISIHTSSGTKSVQALGSCSVTSKYDQLYNVLEGMVGIGG